ncbi:MAG: hypothetical protein RIC14_14290 [Filomicrobium sp.]
MLMVSSPRFEPILTVNGHAAEQTRMTSFLVYLLAFVPVGALLAIAATQTVTPLAYLTKDPLTVAEMASAGCCRIYYGALSNVGILLWCATASICLFSAMVLWLGRGFSAQAQQMAAVFLASGLFSGWMALDDLFLIHENVLPALGVPQKLVYGIYGALTLGYLWFARDLLFAGRKTMFVVALGLLTLSVGVDVVATSEGYMHVLIEDGAKILGISAWAAFHIEAAVVAVHRASVDDAVL